MITRSSLLIGLAILWLIGSLISLTLENSYLGQEAQYDAGGNQVGTVSTLDKLMSPQFSDATNPISAVIEGFQVVWSYLSVIWNMLWWNYAMFVGVWVIFKYIGWCISLGVVISLILAIRG
jgi:hypothetical protein